MKQRKEIAFCASTDFPHVALAISVEQLGPKPSLTCRELHFLMEDLGGVVYYYNKHSDGVLDCRYEWTKKWNGEKHGIHIGLLASFRDAVCTQAVGYITTNDVCLKGAALPPLTDPEIQLLAEECLRVLYVAVNRATFPQDCRRSVVFYLECANGREANAFQRKSTTSDGHYSTYRSALYNGKYVTAVAIGVNAESDASAKAVSLERIGLFCALQSLAMGALYSTVNESWASVINKDTRLRCQYTDSSQIYPKRHLLTCGIPSTTSNAFEIIYEAYLNLPVGDSDLFLQSLHAYHASLRSPSEPAHQVVSLVAALSSLASSRRSKCPGTVTCSTCGNLPQHDAVGDRQSIIHLVVDCLSELDNSEQTAVIDILSRVYSKQRSAYVHSAAHKLSEMHRIKYPILGPDSQLDKTSAFTQREDLASLELITRRTLLAWLERRSGLCIREILPDAIDKRARRSTMICCHLSLKSSAAVIPFKHYAPAK